MTEKEAPKFEWHPWNDFDDGGESVLLPIAEPPCKQCEYWKPHRTYSCVGNKMIFDGVRCCIKSDQFHDFSCYREKQ